MIQYYSDLKKIVNSETVKKMAGGQIQKIYSTANYISFAIRTPGKTHHLYIGRGAGHEGVYVSDKAPISQLRQRERFLEYLRKHLSSCGFAYIEIDDFDRIVELGYQKFGKLQKLALFWKARKLYFAHLYQEGPEENQRVLLSWTSKPFEVEESVDLFKFFDEVGRSTDLNRTEGSTTSVTIEDELKVELEQLQQGQLIHKPSFIQRKIQNIAQDLEKAEQWSLLSDFLKNGDEINTYEMNIGDHRFKFPSELNQYERRNLIFDKIKKLKRGEKILNQRLIDAKGMEKENKEAKFKPLPITQVHWGFEKRIYPTKTVVNNEYKVIKLDFGQLAWGLNSQGNDQLRSKWASKEDWWFHLDGHKSSHIIVKSDKIMTPEYIEIAASILAEVSGFNGDWIPVIYTQVKNLKGVSGKAGMVVYKKQKHINCRKVDVNKLIKE